MTEKGGRMYGALATRATTINLKEMSVEVVMTTSAKVDVGCFWFHEDEVLLMSGVNLPAAGQVPLLDSHHNHEGVAAVLGSCRDIHVENGNALVGTVFFSKTAAASEAFQKLREGHLTDFSVGYAIRKHETLEDGASGVYDGAEVTGPCRVVKEWDLYELSICPIGADPAAKARGKHKGDEMLLGDQATVEEKKRAKAAADDQEDKAKAATDDQDDKDRATPDDDESGDEDGSGDEEGSGDEDGSGDDDEKKKGKKDKGALILRAERARITEITAMCRSFGISDKRTDQFIKDGTSEADARKAIMDGYLNNLGKGPAFGGARVLHDARDKFRARALDGLILRGGGKVDKPAEGAREIRGMTLREMAFECLVAMGERPSFRDIDRLVLRALSTSDLPILLEETSRRFLLEGYQDASETWPLWAGEGVATDFKKGQLVDMSLDSDFFDILQDGEYRQARMAESAEEFKIATYGRIFVITRESIINDDLGVFTTVPAQMGQAASRKVGDEVYGVLIRNDPMGDGIQLFDSATHKNVVPGGGVPTVDTLADADLSMGLQKDLLGVRRLNIVPQHFIAPLSLRVGSETFFSSQLIGTAALPGVQNIYAGKFIRVYEPRLDDLSKTDWYLTGPKNLGVRVFYLNGVREPWVQRIDHQVRDGVTFKARLDVGVKAVSWRAFVKSKKAA
ncbi:MAG: HK97 family phage prohead protease [Deltaproteobacteria bacterium]|jgi:hypothetical protein|nr:HK97 family phage prohead protease [Deltaproteobacteria bacterium]